MKMKKHTPPTLGKLSQEFWDSLDGDQRALLSLTVNHEPCLPSDLDWKFLNNYQKNAILKRFWLPIKKQKIRIDKK